MGGNQRNHIGRKALIITATIFAALFLCSAIASLLPFGVTSSSIIPLSHAQSSPAIFAAPDISIPGQKLFISGDGFSSSDTYVTVYFGSNCPFSAVEIECGIGNPLQMYPPASYCPVVGGTFNCYFIAPSVPNGYSFSGNNPPPNCVLGAFVQTYVSGQGGSEICPLTAIGSSGDYAGTGDFSVANGISVIPSSGPPGTVVNVYGDGYAGNVASRQNGAPVETELDINFNGQQMVKAVMTPFESEPACLPNPNGQITDNGPCTFTIPEDSAGTYTISAAGWADGLPDVTYSTTFTITSASIAATPAEQVNGGSASVSGYGFDPQDTSATLTLADNYVAPATVATGCQVSNGKLEACQFTVPSSFVPGPYNLVAKGYPGGDSSSEIIFSIPGSWPLSISPQSALSGSQIKVTGYAFHIGDTSVSLSISSPNTVQDITPAGGCPISQTVAQGSFSCTVTVPMDLAAGTHIVSAKGNTYSDLDLGTIVVMPSISLSQLNATVGGTVLISGGGFSASDSTVQPYFNGAQTGSSCSITGGSFSDCLLDVPEGIQGGSYQISVVGNTGDTEPPVDLLVIPSITLSQSAGPKGTNITIFGTGFQTSQTELTACLSFPGGTDGQSLGNTCEATQSEQYCPSPSTDGTFACSVVVPGQSVLGEYFLGNFTVYITNTIQPTFTQPFSDTIVALAPFTIRPLVTLYCNETPCISGNGNPISFLSPVGMVGLAGTSFNPFAIPFEYYGTNAAINFGGTTLGYCGLENFQNYPGATKSLAFCPNSGFTIPNVQPGIYSVAVVGNEGDTGYSNYTVLGLIATPIVEAGYSVTISGYALPSYILTDSTGLVTQYPTTSIDLSISQILISDSCPVAVNGFFSCSVGIPTTTHAGTYTVTGTVNNPGCTSPGIPLCSYTSSLSVSLSTNTGVSCAPSEYQLNSGTQVTCTADVYSSASPTGSVSFTSDPNSTDLNLPVSCNLQFLTDAEAQCIVTFTPGNPQPGPYSIFASYSGTTSYLPSEGGTTIDLKQASTTSVSCSANPVAVASTTVCTATVTGANPTGTVTFTASESNAGSFSPSTAACTLDSSGECNVRFSPSSVTNQTISAMYEGDDFNVGSFSTTDLTVTKAHPSLTFVCNLNSIASGSGTDCTAQLIFGDNPTGSVTFTSSSTAGYFDPPSCGLSKEQCSTGYADGAAGTPTLTATYNGDANNYPATATFGLTINPAPTTTSVSCSPDSVLAGVNTTCTVNVSYNIYQAYEAAPNPVGTVTFMSSSWTGSFTPLASCNLPSPPSSAIFPSASCKVSYSDTTPASMVTITANYHGDPGTQESYGTTTISVIKPLQVTLNLSPAKGSSSIAADNYFTIGYSLGGVPKTLQVTGTSVTFGTDYSSVVTVSPESSASSSTNRWCITVYGGNCLQTSFQTGSGPSVTQSYTYYDEFLVAFSYNIANTPAGMPTNPTVSFTQAGGSATATALETTSPSAWVDAGSPVTYTDPISGVSGERWIISPSDAGTYAASTSLASSATLDPTYYHPVLGFC